MNIDDFIEYMVVTGQVDDNFALKETCHICGNLMDNIDDEAFPYYCPICDMFISKDKTISEPKEK